MTIEEQLKNEILNNYKSVRAFTQKIDIPYSTLDTIFKRGIGGVGVNTVLKIFNELSLDIESIDKGVLTHSDSKNSPVLNTYEKKLISSYRSLNNQGKQKLLEYSEDLIGNAKYTTPDFSDIKEKHAWFQACRKYYLYWILNTIKQGGFRMSAKEKIINLINDFSEEQLEELLTMLQSLRHIVDDAEDDAYCQKLYDEYKNNPSDSSENVSLEDFANELGINLW